MDGLRLPKPLQRKHNKALLLSDFGGTTHGQSKNADSAGITPGGGLLASRANAARNKAIVLLTHLAGMRVCSLANVQNEQAFADRIFAAMVCLQPEEVT
jgi:hypothetical protein